MRSYGQRGSALLIVVIFALVLGLTCAAMVVASAANATSSQESLSRVRALTVAEIAVERTKGQIVAGQLDVQFANQAHRALVNDTVYTPDGSLYGSYSALITENYGGQNGHYLVVTRGVVGRTLRQLEEVIQRTPPEMPDLLAAINLYNPNSLANFSGSPPNVCGMDTNIPLGIPFASLKASDCTAASGPGPDAVGIGVHDNPSVSQIVSSLGKKPYRVTGTNGTGGSEIASVYNVGLPNPTGRIDTRSANDIVQLAQDYADMAEYVYDGGLWLNSDGTAVSGDFGTVSHPRIVSIRNSSGGTLHMNGNLAGVGVLVIDCDVRFGGTFNYAGLVVITNLGNATVDIDMAGTPLIMGSMIAANPGVAATSVLDLRGTADVFYSRQGLALAQQALIDRARFTRKYYAEKRPDANVLALP
jgi:hypothetical protein